MKCSALLLALALVLLPQILLPLSSSRLLKGLDRRIRRFPGFRGLRGPQPNNLYIDMGVFPYSTPGASDCMQWYPVEGYDYNCLTQVYTQFWENLHNSGVEILFFSFAQVANIPAIAAHQAVGDYLDSIDLFYSDSLYYPILPGTGAPASITTANNDLLGAYIQLARDNGFQCYISFGGAYGNAVEWKLPGEDPQQLAQTLLQWGTSYGVAGYDFDIESPDFFQVNTQQQIITFLQTLSASVPITAAVLGSFSTSPSTWVLPYFNFINLMLYEGRDGSEYVSPAQIAPYIELSGGGTSTLCIGFDSETHYEDPVQSCGAGADDNWCPVIPPNTSRGTAAWMTYVQALQATSPGYSPSQFGPTFWWTDDPGNLVASDPAPTQVLLDFWSAATSSPPRRLPNPVSQRAFRQNKIGGKKSLPLRQGLTRRMRAKKDL